MALKTSLKRLLWTEKLGNPLGYVVIVAACLANTFLIARAPDIGFAVLLIGVPLGMVYAVLCLTRPMFAIGVAMFSCLMLGFLPRLLGTMLPLGILIDVSLYLAFGGLILRQIMARGEGWALLRQPFVYIYLILVAYILLQAVNPASTSPATYGLLLRRFLSVSALFVVVMCEFKSLRFLVNFIKIWLCTAFLAGVYGCKQEWFGLSSGELAWLSSDKEAFGLIFIGGRYRIFSFMPDPTSFGIFMTISILFCLALILGKFSARVKITAAIIAIPMVLAMAYSGTRTAYAMLPGGLVIYVLMTLYKRSTIVLAGCLALVGAFIMYAPIYNPVILRIRSTFEGSKDPSMNVRNVNRRAIQPYIWSHPIGGGMGMAGGRGPHNGGHRLGGFPPDSGYLQTAVEQGWIGLFIQCLLYGAALYTFVIRFYQCRNPVLQSLILGFAMVVFALALAQYGQATEQVPNNLILYAGMAFVCRIKDFDATAIRNSRQPTEDDPLIPLNTISTIENDQPA